MTGPGLAAVVVVVVILLAIWFVLRKHENPVVRQIAGFSQTLGIAVGLLFLFIWPFVVQAFYIPSESMVPTVLEGDRLLVSKYVYYFRAPSRGEVAVFRAPKEASEGDGDPQGPQEYEYIKRIGAVPGDVLRITAAYVIAGDMQFNHDEVKAALVVELGGAEDTPLKLTEQGAIFGGQQVERTQLSMALTRFPNTPMTIYPGKLYLNGEPVDEPYCPEDCADPYPIPGRTSEWNYYDNGQPAVKIPAGHYLMLGDNRNDSADGRSWGLLERKRFTGKASLVFWPAKRFQRVK